MPTFVVAHYYRNGPWQFIPCVPPLVMPLHFGVRLRGDWIGGPFAYRRI